MTAPRSGRRPGSVDTRATILDSARRAFSERGYDAVTVRAIAADAGVDAALVHHYFGTKESVFVAALQLPFDPAAVAPLVLSGDPAGLGERLVRMLLSVWSTPQTREPILALVRSATTNEQAATLLREFVTRALLGRIAPAIDGPDRELRVAGAASQLVGLALLRYVVRVEPLASATDDEVVALVAPNVQRYLTPT
jgi:AcrR family transcriptional regulator